MPALRFHRWVLKAIICGYVPSTFSQTVSSKFLTSVERTITGVRFPPNNAAPKDEDEVFALLEYPDRVRHVEIVVTSSLLGKMATTMQEPFTELTRLRLSSTDGDMPVLPGCPLRRHSHSLPTNSSFVSQ
ncbi:hypothetical protein V8E53_004562 [Lactarius tabidus]